MENEQLSSALNDFVAAFGGSPITHTVEDINVNFENLDGLMGGLEEAIIQKVVQKMEERTIEGKDKGSQGRPGPQTS